MIMVFSLIAALIAGRPAAAAEYLADLRAMNGGDKMVDASQDLPSLSGSFLAAQIAAANGDEKAAIENYRRAVKLDPENIGLKQSLFVALAADGQFSEAISLLQSVPKDAQNQNINHVVAGANALKQKSWAQAIARLEKVNGTDLDNMLARLVAAWAHRGARNDSEALAFAAGIEGPDWMVMIKEYHSGLIRSAAGDDAGAVQPLEIAVSFRSVAGALTETYMRAMEALARAYARDEKVDRAISVVDDGLSLIPQHPALLALKSKLEAGETVHPLVKTAQQGAAEVFYNIGSAISRQGRSPFAQTHLQLARFMAPNTDVALFSLANVYQQQDKLLQSNEYYRQIAETSPFYRSAQLEYAVNLNQLDQFPESKNILSALIDADGTDLIAVLTLGGLYASKEDFASAANLYDAAIDRIESPDREHWNVFYRRGIAYERTGQWPKAEADFKMALSLYPDQPDVLNYLGYSWIDQGINLDEGLDLIRKAVELKPNSGYIIDSLGWAYYRLGRYEEAVTELESALEKMPSDPVINDHLGDAYWQTGRKLEAVFQWKHALANEPTEKDAERIRTKLQVGLTN